MLSSLVLLHHMGKEWVQWNPMWQWSRGLKWAHPKWEMSNAVENTDQPRPRGGVHFGGQVKSKVQNKGWSRCGRSACHWSRSYSKVEGKVRTKIGAADGAIRGADA